jgi:hypothetical protein
VSYNRQKVLDVAAGEVGYCEKASNKNLDIKTANAGKNNWTKYARDLDAIPGFYNGKKNGYAWCDVFVDWCFVQAYGVNGAKALLNQPNKSLGAGCKYSANYYKKLNRFHTSGARVGDQIFFKKGVTITHTGLVYAVDSKYVYTIEGNTSGSSGVVANGGMVCKKRYQLTYANIYGYGRPEYDDGYKETTTAVTPTGAVKTVKVDAARSFDKIYNKSYRVTANSGLNMRSGAGTNKSIIDTLKKGAAFRCYGYYTKASNGTIWLYGVSAGKKGFCSKQYLA